MGGYGATNTTGYVPGHGTCQELIRSIDWDEAERQARVMYQRLPSGVRPGDPLRTPSCELQLQRFLTNRGSALANQIRWAHVPTGTRETELFVGEGPVGQRLARNLDRRFQRTAAAYRESFPDAEFTNPIAGYLNPVFEAIDRWPDTVEYAAIAATGAAAAALAPGVFPNRVKVTLSRTGSFGGLQNGRLELHAKGLRNITSLARFKLPSTDGFEAMLVLRFSLQ